MRKLLVCVLFLYCAQSPGIIEASVVDVIDSRGGIHSIYVERDAAGHSLDYSLAERGGAVESARIFSHPGQVTSPALYAAPDGAVLAAWSAASGGRDAVFVSRKTADGWDGPVKISADKPYPAVLPEFHAAEDGGVYLSWLGYDGERYAPRFARLEEGAWIAEDFAPAPAGYELKAAENLDWNKYVGFGDSVTAGVRRVPWDGDGYISPLARRLRDIVNPTANVINRGRGGERTIGGVNRIDSVLREERAGHILIMEGINDLQARLSYNVILFNLQEMVRKSIEYGTVPVVGVLPPRDDSHAWQSYTEEFNDDYLRPYLKQEGILMADHWKYFNEQPNWRNYMDPGDQHPNPAGYDLLAEAWLVALEPDAPPSGFTGWSESGCVVLAWEENTEYGHAGYNVYRSVGQVDEFFKLNEELLREPFFRDCEPPEGHLYYAAVAVDRNGNESGFSEFYSTGDDSGGMCFIATAAFGTPLADEVKILSALRDDCLLGARIPRRMVFVYYKLGPAAALVVDRHPPAAALVRAHLKPVVRAVRFFLN